MRPINLYDLQNLLRQCSENPVGYGRYINIVNLREDLFRLVDESLGLRPRQDEMPEMVGMNAQAPQARIRG